MNTAPKPSRSSVSINREALRGSWWLKLYDSLVPLLVLAARIASLRNDKIKRTLHGRGQGLRGWRLGVEDPRPLILIHVASAGEYEGSRPLIDRLLTEGRVRVAVSFSSPSAQPVVEATTGLWACGFLPLDYLLDQLRLLGRLEPTVILVFKHDFWPNLIRAAAALRIPLGLINANFHARSKRHYPLIRSFHKAFMKPISFIWTVSQTDADRIDPLLGIKTELKVGGDTRYDRVLIRAEQGRKRFAELNSAFGDSKVLIGGSTWPPGEKIIWEAFRELKQQHPDLKLVLAPHEPTPEALQRNRETAGAYRIRLLSEWQGQPLVEDVLLIDSVGVLADLYAVGWAAYVGGGFGRGVHSVIEPAAHDLPVCFGPNHHVSHEAGLLIQSRGGFVVQTADDLVQLWGNWLADETAYQQAARAAHKVVTDHAGATDRVLQKIESYIK